VLTKTTLTDRGIQIVCILNVIWGFTMNWKSAKKAMLNLIKVSDDAMVRSTLKQIARRLESSQKFLIDTKDFDTPLDKATTLPELPFRNILVEKNVASDAVELKYLAILFCWNN
jgi:hypothetical protein